MKIDTKKVGTCMPSLDLVPVGEVVINPHGKLYLKTDYKAGPNGGIIMAHLGTGKVEAWYEGCTTYNLASVKVVDDDE